MKKVDCIIVGQGLAGTVLAHHLIDAGLRIHIIDPQEQNTSSKVAGGLFNPVTGRRWVQTWLANDIFPYLHHYYPLLEDKLKDKFFFPMPILRPFSSLDERKILEDKLLMGSSPYLKGISYEKFNGIQTNLGCLHLNQTGYLDLKRFLAISTPYFKELGVFQEAVFEEADLKINAKGLQYKDIASDHIVYCNGLGIQESEFFVGLNFNPVKGELISISCPGLEQRYIFNQGVFILPLGNDIFRVGSTYDWKNLDVLPTAEGKAFLLDKLKKLIQLPFEVVDHQAGVRPTTVDRRPFVGQHPEIEQIWVLNGLGTKGVSLAPYFAKQLSLAIQGEIQMPQLPI